MMELQHGSEVSLGIPVISTDMRANKSVPDFMQTNAHRGSLQEMLGPSEEQKALIDIYAELLRLRDDIHTQSEALAEIITYIRMPWYARIIAHVKGWF
jgi:hypothetical protein